MRIAAAVVFAMLLFPSIARAERYALIVTGAAGGDVYDQKYSGWRTAFTTTLRDSFKYDADRIITWRREVKGQQATRQNTSAPQDPQGMTKDDRLPVLLIGHGTSLTATRRSSAQRPDLTASEWSDLLAAAGRLVFVTTGAGASRSCAISLRGRVLTATDSAAQQFGPCSGVFRRGVQDAADPKNGRVSIWEDHLRQQRRASGSSRRGGCRPSARCSTTPRRHRPRGAEPRHRRRGAHHLSRADPLSRRPHRPAVLVKRRAELMPS